MTAAYISGMKSDANDAVDKAAILARSRARKARMTTHISHSFKEADDWDLEYWQSVGPEERLSALVTLRSDLGKVEAARGAKHEFGS